MQSKMLQSVIDGIAGGACASLQTKMLQSVIDGIAGGACAPLQTKKPSSLGNCCSVGVTTAAGRVAGGVFMLCVERGSMKLSTRDSASSSPGFQIKRHGSCFQHTSTPPPASHDRLSAPGTASRASRDGWGICWAAQF